MKYKFREYFYQVLEESVQTLLEMPLLEMASERTDCRIKIQSNDVGLWVHLLCILLKPEHTARHHWKEEVLNIYCQNIADVQRRMRRSKFTAAELYKMLANNSIKKAAIKRYKKKWDIAVEPTPYDCLRVESLLEKMCLALETDEWEETIGELLNN